MFNMYEEVYKMFENHYNYLEYLKTIPIELACSNIACIIDELAAVHKINTMDMWDQMHKNAEIVFKEMGSVDYEV